MHTLAMTMEFLENWNMQLNFKVTAGNMWCFRFFCIYSLKFYIRNMYKKVHNSGLCAMGYPAIVVLWLANYCIQFLIIYLISSFPRHSEFISLL